MHAGRNVKTKLKSQVGKAAVAISRFNRHRISKKSSFKL